MEIPMAEKKQNALPAPARFGLKQFSDVLSDPVILAGDETDRFEVFRDEIVRDLAPMTAHEAVHAEQIVNVEWDIQQHRVMRDTHLWRRIRAEAHKTMLTIRHEEYLRDVEEARVEFERNQPDPAYEAPEEFVPRPFDEDRARVEADEFASKLVSNDPARRRHAWKVLQGYDYNPMVLKADAWRYLRDLLEHHDQRIRDLLNQRRELMRDLEALRKIRPVDAVPSDD